MARRPTARQALEALDVVFDYLRATPDDQAQRVVDARLRALNAGLAQPHQPPTDAQLDAWVATIKPPTFEQLRAAEKRDAAYQREQRKAEFAEIDRLLAIMAKQAMKPKVMSLILVRHYGFPAKSVSEKAINRRLYDLRRRGLKQPVLPTAKRGRTVTR